MTETKFPGRSLEALLPLDPVGWRAPLLRATVVGYRNAPGRSGTCPACLRPTLPGHARRVPNVRTKPYPVEKVERWREFAIPMLFEAAVRAAADAGVAIGDEAFLRGPVAFRIRAVVRRPVGDHRVRSDVPRSPHHSKPDLTNILKLTEDCATEARWWRDDGQVWTQRPEKLWQSVPAHRCAAPKSACRVGEAPFVRILAWELESCS